ncbi:MAG: DUF721 domain-containing protein [Pseudomonadota bacterium]
MITRPPSKPTLIGEIIAKSMDQGFLGLAKEMARVFDVWAEAVGEYNAANSRPESLNNGRLTVIVESAAWIDRLSYLKQEFIDRLNQALPGPLVKEIKFQVGRVALRESPDRAGEGRSHTRQPAVRPLRSPEARAALDSVKDPELRKKLADLLGLQSDDRK